MLVKVISIITGKCEVSHRLKLNRNKKPQTQPQLTLRITKKKTKRKLCLRTDDGNKDDDDDDDYGIEDGDEKRDGGPSANEP